MELTQKGEMVSRLQAKAGQIGKILNNLEKYNHILMDSDKKAAERRMERKSLSLSKESTHKKPEVVSDSLKEPETTRNVTEEK